MFGNLINSINFVLVMVLDRNIKELITTNDIYYINGRKVNAEKAKLFYDKGLSSGLSEVNLGVMIHKLIGNKTMPLIML